MLGKRARDVQRCLRNIDSFSDRQASVVAWDSELLRWLKLCVRPRGGPYRGGSFHFEIGFKKHYPKYAPVVSCLTPIYHPNIDPEVEEFNVCVSLLDQWSESYGLEDVVQALLYLMYHPNLNDPLSSLFEVGLDYETFAREVRISLHGGTVVGMRFPKMVEENAEEDEAIVREFVGDRKSPRSLTDMVSGIVQDVLEKVSSSPLPGLLPSQPQLQPIQAPVTAPLDPSTVTGPEDTVVEGAGEGGEACAVGLVKDQDKDSEFQERIYSTISALTDKIIAQKEKLAKDLEEQEAAMQRTQGQGQCSKEKSEESDEAGTASEEEVCEESAAMVAGLLTNLSLQMECLTLIGESLELNDIEGEEEGVTEQNDDSGEGETLSEQLSKALSKAREYGGGGNALAEQLAKALSEQEQLFGSLMERREHLRRRGRGVGPSERGDAREHSSIVLPEPEIESGPVSEPRERGDGSLQHGALSTSATRENGAYVLQEPITEPEPEQRVRNSLTDALSYALSERNRRMEAEAALELSGAVSDLRKGDQSGEKTAELTVESGAVSKLRKGDESGDEMTESVAESERRDEPSDVQHAFANALFSAMTANSRRRHNDTAGESTTIRGSAEEEKSSDSVPEHREVPSESCMIGERLDLADDIEKELEAQQSDSSSEVDSLEEESRITLAKLIEFGGEGNVLAEELAKLRSSVFGLPQQGALSDSASRENGAYVAPTVEPRGGDESGEKTTESESETESEIESEIESATESVSVPQRRDEPSDVQHAFANTLFSAMAANSRPRWSDTPFEPVTVPFPRPTPAPASARTTSLLSSLLSSPAMGPCHPVGGSRAPVESSTIRGSAGEEKASESVAESVAVSEPSRWGEIGEKTTESVAEHRDEPSDVQHAFANALFSAMTANSRRRHNDAAVESTTIRGSVGEEKASESVAESVAVSEPSRWGEIGETTTESVAESEPSRGNESPREEPSDMQHALANALFSAMAANSRRHNNAAAESTSISGSSGDTTVTFSGPMHWENMPRLPASRRTTSALTSAAATCSCHPRRQRRAEEFERVTGLLDELLQATREETEAVEAAIEARRRGEGVSAMVAQYEVQSERSQRVLESIQSTLDSLIPGSTTTAGSDASDGRNTNPSSNAVTSNSATNTRNTNTNFGIRPPPLYHLHNCNFHQHFRANMGRNDAGTPPENSTPDIPIPEILERVEAMLQSIAENGEPNEDLLPSDSDTYFTEDEEEEDDEEEDVDDADFFRRMSRYRGEDDDDDDGNDYVVVPRPPTPPRGSRRNRDNEAPVEEPDLPLWSIPIFVAIVASHIIDLTGMFAL